MSKVTADQVRESITNARALGEQFFSHIVWQIENRAWEALGYADWDEMREAEYADMKGIIAPRQDRPELVTRMRQAGMTQRAIAANLGVTQQTVSNDLNTNTGNQRQPATITNARGQERPTSYQRPTITRTETHKVTETIDAETGEINPPKPQPAAEPYPAFDVNRALNNYIDSDPEIQHLRAVQRLQKSITGAVALLQWEPADAANLLDEERMGDLERTARNITDWVARVRAARPTHLRLIGGQK